MNFREKGFYSSYTRELPEEDLEWEGRAEGCAKANEVSGNATLASLKALLGE